MPPVSLATVRQQLHWRYAVKKFDPTRKIPADIMAVLEEALTLSPSSSGMQPWGFVVITDPALRTRLRAASYNQSQITDASHLVVLARRHLTPADIDRYIDRIIEVRGVTKDSLAGYAASMHKSVANPAGLGGGSMDAFSRAQTYIALGVLLSTAAMLGVDACPMEGFDPKQYDEILNLPARGLHASVVCTLGYRAADDAFAKFAKVRFKAQDVITHI